MHIVYGWGSRMRLFRTVIAAALVATVSGVSPLLAANAGWVSGYAVDAAARPLPNLRVELVEAVRGQPVGVPLQAKLTDGLGAWSFNAVPAGDYVVRMVDGDWTAGVPVSVAESSGATGVLIVAPSLPPSERFSQGQGVGAAAAGAGGLSTAAVAIATVAAVAATVAVVVVVQDAS